ncbi:hypothetical protein, partial [Stenotrophomonas sp. SG1]|uniref:hypothetical protein n=1 Tax=Stenotrophomonas sp. SG1 TaxID=2944932 RepID=UPI002244EB46
TRITENWRGANAPPGKPMPKAAMQCNRANPLIGVPGSGDFRPNRCFHGPLSLMGRLKIDQKTSICGFAPFPRPPSADLTEIRAVLHIGHI